jgi:UDP-3-O-[3-hydroxymyristoyl] glucosamine N-acyltransferase
MISATAQVDPLASIGEGTAIWGHTHIRDGALIGRNCMIAERCSVDEGAIVGDFCRIQNGVSIYSGVWLKHHVFVGPEVCFTNDLFSEEWPESQDRPPWSFGSTVVGPYTRIGANATILSNITIGSHCVIGAGATVVADVPDGKTVVGVWKGSLVQRLFKKLLWFRPKTRRTRDVIVPLELRRG